MLCALLIFDGPVFPAPLDDRSRRGSTCATGRSTRCGASSRRRPIAGSSRRTRRSTASRSATTSPTSWSAAIRATSRSRIEHHVANMDFERFLELRDAGDGQRRPRRSFRPAARLSTDPVERFRSFVRDRRLERYRRPSRRVLHHLDDRLAAPPRSERRAAATTPIFTPTSSASCDASRRRSAVALIAPRAPRARAGGRHRSDARARAHDVAPAASQGNWKDPRGVLPQRAASASGATGSNPATPRRTTRGSPRSRRPTSPRGRTSAGALPGSTRHCATRTVTRDRSRSRTRYGARPKPSAPKACVGSRNCPRPLPGSKRSGASAWARRSPAAVAATSPRPSRPTAPPRS